MWSSSFQILVSVVLALQSTSVAAVALNNTQNSNKAYTNPASLGLPSYAIRIYTEAGCKGAQTLFDNNAHGNNSCQNVPGSSSGQVANGVAVEANDYCVSLYLKPDCKGPRIVARSISGLCSNGFSAGTTFGGGNGTDVPDWTVMSYIANHEGPKDPGSQVVPTTLVDPLDPLNLGGPKGYGNY